MSKYQVMTFSEVEIFVGVCDLIICFGLEKIDQWTLHLRMHAVTERETMFVTRVII
ncbi:hypothetical protein D3C80_1817190 [compost metagenome]